MSVKHKTEAILDLPHSLEMIEHIWGPRAGVLSELSTTRSFILDTIREYFDCHDINEVCKWSVCIDMNSVFVVWSN